VKQVGWSGYEARLRASHVATMPRGELQAKQIKSPLASANWRIAKHDRRWAPVPYPRGDTPGSQAWRQGTKATQSAKPAPTLQIMLDAGDLKPSVRHRARYSFAAEDRTLRVYLPARAARGQRGRARRPWRRSRCAESSDGPAVGQSPPNSPARSPRRASKSKILSLRWPTTVR
jgi:hypothetical protein